MLILGTVSNADKFLVKSSQGFVCRKKPGFAWVSPLDSRGAGCCLQQDLCPYPASQHAHKYIISSVCAAPLSQGVFPLGKLSTSYKVPGPRPVRPPSLLATSEKAPGLYRFTISSSEVSAPLFSNPVSNLHFALLSQATSVTLTRIPKQYWSATLTGATAQV